MAYQRRICLHLLVFLFLAAVVASAGQQRPSTRFHRQKLHHLHFYFHDVLSGRHPTAMPVAQAPTTNSSATRFGEVIVIDDILTEGPSSTSKIIGRAQGMYTSASQNDVGYLMTMAFAFTTGKYNGSSLVVMGRNAIFSGVREMPVIGGSRLFRWARGYAQAKSYFEDLKTGDAIVEYNVYVKH